MHTVWSTACRRLQLSLARMTGVVVGAGSTTFGVAAAFGVVSLGSGVFLPAVLIAGGLTMGVLCFYNWWKHRKPFSFTPETKRAMQLRVDAIRDLYIAFKKRTEMVWNVINFSQRQCLRLPKRVAVAIMHCASSSKRLDIFMNFWRFNI